MQKGVTVSNGNCQLEEIICKDTFNDLDDVAGYFNDEDDEDQTDLDQPSVPLLTLDLDFSQYQSTVISYIAGFIKSKLVNRIECTQCVKYLLEGEVENILLTLKEWGTLTRPNKNLIKLCKIAESAFKQIDVFNQKHI